MADGTVVARVGEEEPPLPMGVEAETGRVLPALTAADLAHIREDPNAVKARGEEGNQSLLAIADVEPNELGQCGWGVIFAAGAGAEVRAALEPLIEHRRAQVGDPKLFRVFEGQAGYRRGDTVRTWLDRFNLTLAIVDPALGVPLYLTIVGGPAEIPFEFQYLLDAYWCVGRLDFPTVAGYRAYAEGVIAYETAAAAPHAKRVAVFNPRNPGDRATEMLHNQVGLPFAEGARPLGARQGFRMQALLGEDATRANLALLLEGKLEGGPPAVLFSGSHGASFPATDPEQAARQGAIVCQDWEGGALKPEQYFDAAAVSGDARLSGLIHFLFACYGGGCPAFDSYSRQSDGSAKPLMAAPVVARLPQRLLEGGALAVVAHIDRAWTYSFQAGRGAPQTQEFRDVMTRVMRGDRIGQATDQFNMRWAVLSAELADTLRDRQLMPGQVADAALANRWVARDDARNYLILGDPAVRLRVDAMEE